MTVFEYIKNMTAQQMAAFFYKYTKAVEDRLYQEIEKTEGVRLFRKMKPAKQAINEFGKWLEREVAADDQ